MEKTRSELLFEQYCINKGIGFERIEEKDTKTPDYELKVDRERIVVEVKEITQNKEELESDRLFKERGLVKVISNTPGDRVRKKITNSSAQIKARARGQYPSILVLFDRGMISGHLNPYNIRVAMYGLEQVHVHAPRDFSVSPYATGMSYGPKRKMTNKDNTSISAIGVLFTPNKDEIGLHVYHNKFSAVRLNLSLLGRQGIRQYVLEEDVVGSTEKWKKVSDRNEP